MPWYHRVRLSRNRDERTEMVIELWRRQRDAPLYPLFPPLLFSLQMSKHFKDDIRLFLEPLDLVSIRSQSKRSFCYDWNYPYAKDQYCGLIKLTLVLVKSVHSKLQLMIRHRKLSGRKRTL